MTLQNVGQLSHASKIQISEAEYEPGGQSVTQGYQRPIGWRSTRAVCEHFLHLWLSDDHRLFKAMQAVSVPDGRVKLAVGGLDHMAASPLSGILSKAYAK